jgi:hypothetical protein
VCFDKLLFQKSDNLLHIAARNEIHPDFQALSAHFNVRTGEHPEHIHEQLIQNPVKLLLELVKSVQTNELDIVVRLL